MDGKETIFIHVDVHFGWWDRLRLLIGRPPHIRVVQRVWAGEKGTIAHDQATSTVYVESIIPPKPGGGYAVFETPETPKQAA